MFITRGNFYMRKNFKNIESISYTIHEMNMRGMRENVIRSNPHPNPFCIKMTGIMQENMQSEKSRQYR